MTDALAEVRVIAVPGIPEVVAGDSLATIVIEHLVGPAAPVDGDVIVVTSKVVAKAEGRLVKLDSDPDAMVRLIEAQSKRVLRRRGPLRIVETEHGLICANAGIDQSNVDDGYVLLLPVDPDRSARRIRDAVEGRLGVQVGVVVSDTFGRAWRRGVVDVAIGSAGIASIVDLRGTLDANGRELHATEVCVVDEIASAADLVLGKASNTPIAIVRGLPSEWLAATTSRYNNAADIIRPPAEDLFR